MSDLEHSAAVVRRVRVLARRHVAIAFGCLIGATISVGLLATAPQLIPYSSTSAQGPTLAVVLTALNIIVAAWLFVQLEKLVRDLRFSRRDDSKETLGTGTVSRSTVLQRVAIILAVPISLFLGIISFSVIFGFDELKSPNVWWSATAMSVLFSSWVIGSQFNKEFRKTRVDISHRLDRYVSDFETQIMLHLVPSIHILANKDNVRSKIAELIDAELDIQKKSSHSDNLRIEPIVIYGSVFLMPSDAEKSEFESGADNKKTAAELYKDAMDRASSSSTATMHRYVRLFKPHEMADRSREYQDRYLRWLNGQRESINQGRYILYDSQRAPRWMAARSTFIFRDAFVDVFPDADGGILVRGQDISKEIREKYRTYMHGTTVEENKPKPFSIAEIRSFDSYISRIRKAIDSESRKRRKAININER